MIKKLCVATALVLVSGFVGCGRGSDATVVGSEEEYAKIRTSPEKEAEMNAKYNSGPSPQDIKKMEEAAKAAAMKGASGN
jgi:hypothetical protein